VTKRGASNGARGEDIVRESTGRRCLSRVVEMGPTPVTSGRGVGPR
jgi:hypothetical protein